ncbi:MAG TPA: lipopolysaccharide transport periplasmic protein LptA [Dokdonella sp.]
MSIRPCNPRARSVERTVAALLLACTLPAHALSTDRNQPMDVSANYSRINQGGGGKPGTTFLRGDVRVVQGTMKANAAEATIQQDANGAIRRVILTGDQARLEQQQDGGGLMTAQADRIEFDNATSVAELSGSVKIVQQGRGEFRGAHMTYNTNTGQMESGNQEAGGRVHMIIQPKNPAPAAPPQPADGAAGTDTPA